MSDPNKRKKYFQHLQSYKTDEMFVPESFEAFETALSDPDKRSEYYKHLKATAPKSVFVPDSEEAFFTLFDPIKKKEDPSGGGSSESDQQTDPRPYEKAITKYHAGAPVKAIVGEGSLYERSVLEERLKWLETADTDSWSNDRKRLFVARFTADDRQAAAELKEMAKEAKSAFSAAQLLKTIGSGVSLPSDYEKVMSLASELSDLDYAAVGDKLGAYQQQISDQIKREAERFRPDVYERIAGSKGVGAFDEKTLGELASEIRDKLAPGSDLMWNKAYSVLKTEAIADVESKRLTERLSKSSEWESFSEEVEGRLVSDFGQVSKSVADMRKEEMLIFKEVQSHHQEQQAVIDDQYRSSVAELQQKVDNSIQTGSVNRDQAQEYFNQENRRLFGEYQAKSAKLRSALMGESERRLATIKNAYLQKIDEEWGEFSKALTPEETKRASAIISSEHKSLINQDQAVLKILEDATPAGVDFGMGILSTLGRSLSAQSMAAGYADGVLFGDMLQNTFPRSNDGTINDWGDLLDADKLRKSASNLVGSMLTSVGTGFVGSVAAGVATGGNPFAAMAGGAIGSWGAESIDVAFQMYRSTLEETGDEVLARRKAEETIEAQIYNAPLYTLDGLPFVGKALSKIRSVGARVAAGAGAELVTETLQETAQQTQEQAIKETGEWENFVDYLSAEVVEDVFLNVLPVAAFGGGGQLRSIMREGTARAEVQNEVYSELTRLAMAGASTTSLSQWLGVAADAGGVNFAKAMVDTWEQNLLIKPSESTYLKRQIDGFEETKSAAKEYGLSKDQAHVYATLITEYNARSEEAKRYELDPAMAAQKKADADAVLKIAKELLADPANGGSYMLVNDGVTPWVLTGSEAVEFFNENINDIMSGVIDVTAKNMDLKTMADEALAATKAPRLDDLRMTVERGEKVIGEINMQVVHPSTPSGLVGSKMASGEAVSAEEVQAATDHILEVAERVDQSDLSAGQKDAIITALFDEAQKITDYESNKSNEISSPDTQTATAGVERNRKAAISPERFEGVSITLSKDGKDVEGKGVVTKDGRVALATPDGQVIIDTPNLKYVESIFDADGNIEGVTLEDSVSGEVYTISDPDLAIDIATKYKQEEVGSVDDSVFTQAMKVVSAELGVDLDAAASRVLRGIAQEEAAEKETEALVSEQRKMLKAKQFERFERQRKLAEESLNKSFPGSEPWVVELLDSDGMEAATGTRHRGAYLGGRKIYVNVDNARDTTVFHEAAHVVLAQLFGVNADGKLDEALMRKEAVRLFNSVKANLDPKSKLYQSLAEFAAQKGYVERGLQYEEFIVQLIGELALNKDALTAAQKTSVRNWFYDILSKYLPESIVDKILGTNRAAFRMLVDISESISSGAEIKGVSNKRSEKKSGGSAPRFDQDLRGSIIANAGSVINEIKSLKPTGEDGGATLNIDGSPYDGVGLVVPVLSKNFKQDEISPEAVAEWVMLNSGKINNENKGVLKLGFYKFDDRPVVSVDLNVLMKPEHLDVALRFALASGQESVFNLESFETAMSGATGENPRAFSDEEFAKVTDALMRGEFPSDVMKDPGPVKYDLDSASSLTSGRQPDGSLRGLPRKFKVDGVEMTASHWAPAEKVAREYMAEAGLPYNPPADYMPADRERGARDAKLYDEMKHDPTNPEVKEAYDQMVKELMGQWEFIKKSGLVVEFMKPDAEGNFTDPYAASPRLATEDVRNNNHLWVFPTFAGFGHEGSGNVGSLSQSTSPGAPEHISETEDIESFMRNAKVARASRKYGPVMGDVSRESLAGARLFMSEDGQSGFAIAPDGDLLNTYSSANGRFSLLMEAAKLFGVKKVDTLDTGIVEMYKSEGFVEVDREPWDSQYAPEGWSDELGTPDHVYLEYSKPPAVRDPEHPLLADSGEIVNGHPAVYNDIFRAVHDYFGHIKEGLGFRAGGEYNAFRIHASMFSPSARRAMATETHGQNSWVNFGPHGEKNRTANAVETIYADQKVGLLPQFVIDEALADLDASGSLPRFEIAVDEVFFADSPVLSSVISAATGGGEFVAAFSEPDGRIAAIDGKGYVMVNVAHDAIRTGGRTEASKLIAKEWVRLLLDTPIHNEVTAGIVGELRDLLPEALRSDSSSGLLAEWLTNDDFRVDMYGREEVIVEAAEAIGVTGLRPRYHIIGSSADLTSQARDFYHLAKGMSARGIADDVIYRKTGWEKGIDGDWRYEVPAIEISNWSPLGFDEVIRSVFRPGKKVPITEVVSPAYLKRPDSLFKMYPSLMNLTVEYTPEPSMYKRAAAFTETRHIKIGYWFDTKEKFRSTIAHELQHFIQDIEGFERGGGLGDRSVTSGVVDKATAFLGRIYAQIDSMNAAINQGYYLESPDRVPPGMTAQEMIEVVQKEVEWLSGKAKKLEGLIGNIATVLSAADSSNNPDLAFYRSLAGEVEARNVQTRMDLRQNQRALLPFSATEDYVFSRINPSGVQATKNVWQRKFDSIVKGFDASGSRQRLLHGRFEYGSHGRELVIRNKAADNLQDYIDEGLVEFVPASRFSNARVITMSPDDLIVADLALNIDGRPYRSTKALGGVLFPLATNHVWATSKAASSKLRNQINKDVKDQGYAVLALVKGSDGKLTSSAQGAVASMLVIEAMFANDLFSARAFKRAARLAIEDVAIKMNRPISVDFKGKDVKALIDEIHDSIFSREAATYELRGLVVRKIIANLGKEKGVKSKESKIKEFFRLPKDVDLLWAANGLPLDVDPGKKVNMVDEIARTVSEPLTVPLAPGDVYAYIVVESPVEVRAGHHDSYPYHIVKNDNTPPRLMILSPPESGRDILTSLDGKRAEEISDERSWRAIEGRGNLGMGAALVAPRYDADNVLSSQSLLLDQNSDAFLEIVRLLPREFAMQDRLAEGYTRGPLKLENSGVWSYKVENAGDVYRGLPSSLMPFDKAYVMEKIGKLRDFALKNQTVPADTLGRRPSSVDSYEVWSSEKASEIRSLRAIWEGLPAYSRATSLAKDLVFSVLDGDFQRIKEITDLFEENFRNPLLFREFVKMEVDRVYWEQKEAGNQEFVDAVDNVSSARYDRAEPEFRTFSEMREEISVVNNAIVDAIINGSPYSDLIERRNQAVISVAKYKLQNNLPVLDAERERVIISEMKQRAADEGFDPDVVAARFEEIMAASRALQEDYMGRRSNSSSVTQEFFSEVVSGNEDFKPNRPWKPLLPTRAEDVAFESEYNSMMGNFDNHIAASIPTFRELQVRTGAAVNRMLHQEPSLYNEDLKRVGDDYMSKRKLFASPVFKPLSLQLFKRMADFHEQVEDSRFDPVMQKSYRAFLNETLAQYEVLAAAGYDIRPYLGDGEPYGVSSSAVREDVKINSRLFYLQSRSATGSGNENEAAENYMPFESTGIVIDGQDVLFNDLFRAVHDIFGHSVYANSFSAQGELNAFQTHRVMYSEAAQKALFLETVMYNAYYSVNKEYAPRKIYDIPVEFMEAVTAAPLVYDISGSEGGWVKAVTKMSGSAIESINLEPNKEMAKAFRSSPVAGSEIVTEAFFTGFDEYKAHAPLKKADVVHESMTFQFISNSRQGFLEEIKSKYLNADGIFLTEEKLVPVSSESWVANEAAKDRYKLKYFTESQVDQKRNVVLSEMIKHQVSIENYKTLLRENFNHVEEYWDAGNFRGYVASDSRHRIDLFMRELGGKVESEFSSQDSPPRKARYDADFASGVDGLSARELDLSYGIISAEVQRGASVEGSVAKQVRLFGSYGLKVDAGQMMSYMVRRLDSDDVKQKYTTLSSAKKRVADVIDRSKEKDAQLASDFEEYSDFKKAQMKEAVDRAKDSEAAKASEKIAKLKDKIQEIRTSYEAKIKALRSDKNAEAQALRDLRKDLAQAIRSMLPKGSMIGRTLATEIATASTPLAVKKIEDKLAAINAKTIAAAQQAARQEVIDDILSMLNPKAHVRKSSTSKLMKAAVSPEAREDLRGFLEAYPPSVIVGLSDLDLEALHKIVESVYVDGKFETELLQETLSSLRREVKNGVTKYLADKNKLWVPVDSVEDAIYYIEKGERLLVDGRIFTKTILEEFKSIYGETGRISAKAVKIPRQKNRVFKHLKGWHAKTINLLSMLYYFMGTAESQDFFIDNIYEPISRATMRHTEMKMEWEKRERRWREAIFGKGRSARKALTKDSGVKIVDYEGDVIIENAKVTELIYLALAAMQPDALQKAMNANISMESMMAAVNYVASDVKLKNYTLELLGTYELYLPQINQALSSEGFAPIERKPMPTRDMVAEAYSQEVADGFYESMNKLLAFVPDFIPYAPIRVSSQEVVRDQSLPGFGDLSNQDMPSVISGNVIARNNSGDLQISSTIEMNAQWIEGMTNMISKLSVFRTMNAAFNLRNRRLIESQYGAVFLREFMSTMDRVMIGKRRQPLSTMEMWMSMGGVVPMVLNTASAIYQQLSKYNFAFYDQVFFDYVKTFALKAYTSKDYWESRSKIANSPWLQARMYGASSSIDMADLDRASTAWAKHTRRILDHGYILTKLSDANAIISGGTPYYMAMRDRYLRENAGTKPSDQLLLDAEQFAMEKLWSRAQDSQQSSEEIHKSAEQSSPTLRFFLTFNSVNLQYGRVMQQAALDIKHGRGSVLENLGKIAYFGAVQNLVFNFMAGAFSALFMSGDDDEEENGARKAVVTSMNRTANSLLIGNLGVAGGAVAVVKDVMYDLVTSSSVRSFESLSEDEWPEGFREELGEYLVDAGYAEGIKQKSTYELLVNAISSISPPVGIKLRSTNRAMRAYKQEDFLSVSSNVIELTTNMPTQRLIEVSDQVVDAANSEYTGIERALRLVNMVKKYDLDKKYGDIEKEIENEYKKRY